MDWMAWNVSVQGGSHRDRDLPCEYASLVFTGDGWIMAAVADGHGSMKHFRSGIGAELACQAVRGALLALSPETSSQALAQEIIARWQEMVQRYLMDNPWTEEELAVQRTLLDGQAYLSLADGQSAAVAYGTTLVCAVVTDTGWTALQIGDGGLALLDAGGNWSWPMPDCTWCHGNLTASLCMADAASAFRYAGGAAICPLRWCCIPTWWRRPSCPAACSWGGSCTRRPPPGSRPCWKPWRRTRRNAAASATTSAWLFCAMKPAMPFRPCGIRPAAQPPGSAGAGRHSGMRGGHCLPAHGAGTVQPRG